MKILTEIISTKIYEKITNTNIKNLTELKKSKFSQKIILINKIELEKNLPNTELDYNNLFKPLDNLLFSELKEKIKIIENNLCSTWLNTNFFLNDNNIFRSYNDLSKLINLITIKTKIINKICYFYIKYMEQIYLNSMEKT